MLILNSFDEKRAKILSMPSFESLSVFLVRFVS